MNETYCGKDCLVCAEREQTGCGGCQSQRQLCTIAQCCADKGHEKCDTCAFRDGCRKLLGRDRMPSYIQRQREFQQLAREKAIAREAEAARNAPIMAKWLWLMLWMNVPALLINLLGELGDMTVFSDVGNAVCSLIVCWMLLQMKCVDERYGKAAICAAIAIVLNLATTFITNTGLALLISVPTSIVSLVGSYNQYQAHGDVVGAVDAAVGEKWPKLWKWELISVGCMLGGTVLMLIAFGLGAFVVVISALATVVVVIMTIVNLYRSAQAFRKIAA